MSASPMSVSAFTYACIRPTDAPTTTADLVCMDTKLVVEEAEGKSKEYGCDGVFDVVVEPTDIYGTVFGVNEVECPRSLLTMIDSSTSMCLCFMGPSEGGKTAMFQGVGEANHGAVGWVSDEMFRLLGEKEPLANGLYRSTVTVSYYEMYDETIKDLLSPENKDLVVSMDIEQGYSVKGMSKHPCAHAGDLKAKLEYGRKSRNTAMLSTGLASQSTGAFFEITLRQEEGTSVQSLTSTTCKCLLVDVPSTTKLVGGASEAREKEGATLSKSLFTFEKVIKSLSKSGTKLSTPFENSTFTHVLHDTLGMASIVMGIACLTQGSPKVSKETMKLLGYFRKMSNYPMANSEFMQGVLMKYRAGVANLLDRIEELRVESTQPKAEDEATLKRLRNLEQELLQANISSSTASEDGTKCFKMLELFKAKYSKLVADKAMQARELILSEEQKLHISKALIEVKMANGEMAEKFETEKFEITNAMMNAKTEVSDLDIKLRDVEDQLLKSQDNERKAVELHTTIQKELGEQVNQGIETSAKLGVEMEKGTELGTELLTLVNQKASFQKENALLNAKCETQEGQLKEFEERDVEKKKEFATLKVELGKEKEELEQVRGEKMKVELEMRKSVVGYEQSRLDLDKNTADFVRTRDNEMFQVRKNAEEDILNVRREKEDLAKANNKLEAQVRTLERKIRDIENNIGRNLEQSNTLNREKRDLEQQLRAERDNYRSKMLAYLGEEAMAAGVKNEEINKYLLEGSNGEEKKESKNVATNDGGATEANNRVALESLINTYKERERSIQSDVERLEGRNAEVTRKNHLLYDKYREVRDLLEDATEDSNVLPDDIPDEKDLKVTASELEQEKERELTALRGAVKTMQTDTSVEKEKSVQLSETYRDRAVMMEAQLKELTNRLSLAEKEKNRLEKDKEEEKDNKTMSQIEDMQQNIIDQLSNIKISADNIGPGKGEAGGGGLGVAEAKELRELRKKLKKQRAEEGGAREEAGKYRSENLSLKEEVGKLKMKLLEGGGGSGGGGGGAGEGVLRAQLRESESNNTKLNSKVVALTQQLEDYEAYMKKTVRGFKAEIKGLKGE